MTLTRLPVHPEVRQLQADLHERVRVQPHEPLDALLPEAPELAALDHEVGVQRPGDGLGIGNRESTKTIK